jgi:starch phosphorylase
MRPLRTFTVEPSLPEALKPLQVIAHNLWWTWHSDAQDLFRRMDRDLWEQCYHNPVAMLGLIDQRRLQEVAADDGFLAHMSRVDADLRSYLEAPGWWIKTFGGEREPQVAYFCAEYGISECLPIYSGGLGVLAGDHLKSASDLGLPLVAVGMLYQQGYFRQRLNADGWQLELFPRNDFHNLPVEPVRNSQGQPVTIEVEMPNRLAKAQVWVARVGRIRLYLLDSNVPENTPEDRHITSQLYGGDQEMRIRQEILLGIGGVRMLQALGIRPKAFHMNEGHSSFLGLERCRLMMAELGTSFDEARELVAATNVFTTHTPVPAGNDAFEPWLIEKYFGAYWGQLGLNREQFLALGRQEPSNKDEPLNMTVLALHMSGARNGVSGLHAEVSRKLWAGVWPGVPVSEIPIRGIRNGIHTPSWLSHDMGRLYDRYLGPGWHEKTADPSVWRAVDQIPDTELWRTHERRRERLVAFARRRLREQLLKRRASAAELAAAEEVLDPEALTIGFARRFATYKRATLLLADLDRLARLVGDPHRRMQIIFAGKAHPRDNPGKDLIREIVHTSRQERFRRCIMFLEDYDMNVARYLVQGVDIWLNTPLRPMEASGTSGMKAAANGAINVSVLDGWWAEGYDPSVGWAIGGTESYDDLEYQNTVQSQALYDLLEKEVIPLFYERGSDGLPRGWTAKMKATMGKLAPVFNTNRMMLEYGELAYLPAIRQHGRLTAGDLAAARQLSAWKQRVRQHFAAVRLENVSDNTDSAAARVGGAIDVSAVVNAGQLTADDLAVELYFGQLDEDGQLSSGQTIPMKRLDAQGDGRVRYAAQLPCSRSGMTGYTVRILPHNDLMAASIDMGLIRWP